MEKIGTDVYCFDTFAHTALLTSGRLMLVDTGTKPDGSLLLPEIEKTGYKVADIESIIITHTHPDHVGGLAKLKELTDAKVVSHEIESKYISKEVVYDGPPGRNSQRHTGTPVDVKLTDGDLYEGLLVIFTPGHTPGHISLLDTENSLLFAGDAMRHDPDGLASMADRVTQDPQLHRDSIRKLANYSFERIIFGHGDPINQGAKKMLNSLISTLS